MKTIDKDWSTVTHPEIRTFIFLASVSEVQGLGPIYKEVKHSFFACFVCGFTSQSVETVSSPYHTA